MNMVYLLIYLHHSIMFYDFQCKTLIFLFLNLFLNISFVWCCCKLSCFLYFIFTAFIGSVNTTDLCILILHSETFLNLLINSNVLFLVVVVVFANSLGFLDTRSCHLQIRIVYAFLSSMDAFKLFFLPNYLARVSTMLNRSGKTDIFVLFLILAQNIQFYTKYDVRCGFLVDALISLRTVPSISHLLNVFLMKGLLPFLSKLCPFSRGTQKNL